MKHIKLIAFDLDGTLLKDNKELAPETMEALQQAASAGICLVPTTGRLYNGVPEEIRNQPFIRYVIAANGAEVYDAKEKKVLHRAELSIKEVRQFFEFTQGVSAIVGCYKGGQGFMGREDMEKMEAYAAHGLFRMMRRVYVQVEDLQAYLLETGDTVQKLMLFFADLEERKKVLFRIKKELSELAVSSSIDNNIEVNAKTAHKGAALKFLYQHLQIDREETAAFGDGSNDVSMLLEAGIGIAMENACSEAKKAADKVTLSNEQGGVAYMIKEILNSY